MRQSGHKPSKRETSVAAATDSAPSNTTLESMSPEATTADGARAATPVAAPVVTEPVARTATPTTTAAVTTDEAAMAEAVKIGHFADIAEAQAAVRHDDVRAPEVKPGVCPPPAAPTHATAAEEDSPADAERLAYTIALSRLSALKRPAHPEVNAHIDAIIAQADFLQNQGESVTELTLHLNHSADRVTGRMTSEAFKDSAKNMQGHASTAWKVLGGLMMALAITLATLAIVFAAPIVAGVAATLAISTAAAQAVTIAGAGVASGVPVAMGLGFFSKVRNKGLAQAAHQLDAAVQLDGSELDGAQRTPECAA